MKPLALLILSATLAAPAGLDVVTLPGKSPLVTLRVVFRTGAASDPAAKSGVAGLTAAMLSEGGTRTLEYKQIVDKMFPMATGVSSQVDKEMTVFASTTHIDNLEEFYRIFRDMLLDPGWRTEDFERLRDDMVNYLRVSLRGNNDEELGKEVLYNEIYAGHPYGRHNWGTVASLQKLTVADVKQFYTANYTRANLILGVAGGYPADFLARLRKDFEKLPAGSAAALKLPEPRPIPATRVTLIEKATRSVAFSFGYPIEVRRGHPDFPALLVAQSWLGQHRMSGGRLYERIRQIRGINYGDYAYIEYFPRGMFQFEPDPNLVRQQQIFQIWIRPVEPPAAHFTLRLALFELERMIRDGLGAEDFERTRNFLTKNTNLLTKTSRAELGYAIDSLYYRIPDYNTYVRTSLARLTREDVNRAIRKHLRADRLQIVAVGAGMEDFRKRLLADDPSPITYNSPKPDDILAEDKLVERRKLGLKPELVRIVPVDRVFEQ